MCESIDLLTSKLGRVLKKRVIFHWKKWVSIELFLLETSKVLAILVIFRIFTIFDDFTFFILADTQARSMFFGKSHIFSESSKSKLSYAQRTKLIAWKITEIQAKQSKIIHQKTLKIRVHKLMFRMMLRPGQYFLRKVIHFQHPQSLSFNMLNKQN